MPSQPSEIDNTIPEIRAEDFQSIVLHLSFFNITTKTEVSEGKRYIGDQLQKAATVDSRMHIDLVEFREDGMVIEVPGRSGATGHQLNMNIWTENSKPNIDCNFVVTVNSVEKLSPERDQFEVFFNEYDSKVWKELQELFASRQNEIDDFLKAARGY